MSLPPLDLALLEKFENGLDPRQPENSTIPARVLGYGEISTVFEIQTPGLAGLALKRLPLFHSLAEVERYQAVHAEYNRLLELEVGLRLPEHAQAIVPGRSGAPVFYIVQGKMPGEAIGSRLIHQLPEESVLLLVRRVLRELRRVWYYNRAQARVQLGIDGQISNWALADAGDVASAPLVYFDTSTPLYRVDKVEQLDTELFLRNAPSFLAWLLRLLFLKDVVARYYDFRRVAIDLAANFIKEQKPELIPPVVRVVNDLFASEAADLGIRPVTEKEVADYYREDALIWTLYLSMRKVDRFLRTRVGRGEYPYILPERIRR